MRAVTCVAAMVALFALAGVVSLVPTPIFQASMALVALVATVSAIALPLLLERFAVLDVARRRAIARLDGTPVETDLYDDPRLRAGAAILLAAVPAAGGVAAISLLGTGVPADRGWAVVSVAAALGPTAVGATFLALLWFLRGLSRAVADIQRQADIQERVLRMASRVQSSAETAGCDARVALGLMSSAVEIAEREIVGAQTLGGDTIRVELHFTISQVGELEASAPTDAAAAIVKALLRLPLDIAERFAVSLDQQTQAVLASVPTGRVEFHLRLS